MRLFFAALMLVLSACSGGQNVQKAEQAIERFHSQLNRQEFEQIHDQAGSGWKKATSKTDAIKLFSAIRMKMGAFKAGKQNGWRINYTPGGTFVVVQYISQYERGEASETFTYRDAEEKLELFGYNINSKVLITG